MALAAGRGRYRRCGFGVPASPVACQLGRPGSNAAPQFLTRRPPGAETQRKLRSWKPEILNSAFEGFSFPGFQFASLQSCGPCAQIAIDAEPQIPRSLHIAEPAGTNNFGDRL